MTLHKCDKLPKRNYISTCFLLLLVCFQDGTLAASTAKRHKKIDPKYEQAVLDALGMKRAPQNTSR